MAIKHVVVAPKTCEYGALGLQWGNGCAVSRDGAASEELKVVDTNRKMRECKQTFIWNIHVFQAYVL
jgi:hypothetical protein